ncbi:2,3-dimethylmalate lyase [Hyphodiscus hymeniophilus]|uniref:2,3-dimethylmalate lyase n=1 Tax=Hyphodiscus hymeniophilus TaxID=353542 RepID=A0A9P7AWL8_9HELO|nr:2,3-dimethylmalate lyase [Hyphodiscus hymeniophilus]
MSKPTTPVPAAAKLRELLAEKDKVVVCPGVYDGFTARIALAAGFDALYMTGAGTTMSMLGQADLGIATLNDMVQNAGMIAGLNRKLPLIADADTGYGGPLMVGRTTAQYMQAGVAAFHLEDQVQTKRCGHLRNKELVDEEVFLSRIKAAVNMRVQTPGDILIIARTDALQSLGFEAALNRLKKAIAIGADIAFLEGIANAEQAKQACQELSPTPVLLNNVAGGLTPKWTVQEAKDLGFKIVIYPGFALGPVYKAVADAAKELKETGDLQVPTSAGPKAIFEICGLKEAIEFDIAAGGNLYVRGV